MLKDFVSFMLLIMLHMSEMNMLFIANRMSDLMCALVRPWYRLRIIELMLKIMQRSFIDQAYCRDEDVVDFQTNDGSHVCFFQIMF